LKSVFGECAHVDLIELDLPAKDRDIWNYAKEHDYIIITKDNDFVNLLEFNGFPPRVVLIKTGNNDRRALAELFISAKSMIEDLEHNNYGLLEIVGPTNPPTILQ
jgi:predicted nuclease of predicted toxin-antitoxin system